jgi:membrane-associated protease RseP (regulator of RpoE activity)
VLVNLVMWAFNLFPLPPLDGGRILVGLLPWRQAQWWRASSPGASSSSWPGRRRRRRHPVAAPADGAGLRPINLLLLPIARLAPLIP